MVPSNPQSCTSSPLREKSICPQRRIVARVLPLESKNHTATLLRAAQRDRPSREQPTPRYDYMQNIATITDSLSTIFQRSDRRHFFGATHFPYTAAPPPPPLSHRLTRKRKGHTQTRADTWLLIGQHHSPTSLHVSSVSVIHFTTTKGSDLLPRSIFLRRTTQRTAHKQTNTNHTQNTRGHKCVGGGGGGTQTINA